MLQAIRSSTGSWIVKGFLGVIALSFAVWGVGDMVTGGSDATVIVIGDEEIAASAYNREFQRQSRTMQARFNRVLDTDMLRVFGVFEQTERSLVDRSLLAQASDQLGLAVSEDYVVKDTYATDIFKNSLGRFDPVRFDRIIANQGLSQEGYFAARRGDFAREHLVRSVAGRGVVPSSLVDALYAYREERRVAEVLVILSERFQDIPAPDDTALSAFYEANEDLFTAPEYRAATYLALSAVDLLDEVSADEEELREAYDANLDEFITRATRTVRQMVIDDQATAKAAHAALLEGRAFDAVGTEFASVIDLGRVTREELPADVADAVFALGEGEISAPIKSAFGWHIATASEIVEEVTRSFEEVRTELDRTIRLEKAGDALFDLGNRLQDELAGGATIEEIAVNIGLRATNVEAVDAGGSDRDGQPVEGIARGGDLVRTIFQVEEGIVSDLIETEEGGYLVVRVDRVIAPALRPFDEVRGQLVIGWQVEARNERAAAEAERLAAQVRGGRAPAEIAAEENLERRLSPALKRSMGRAQTLLSEAVLAQLFTLKEGEVATGAGAGGQTQVVARLSEIRRAGPNSEAAVFKNLRQELESGLAADRLTEFRNALGRQFPIEVDRGRIDAMYRGRSG